MTTKRNIIDLSKLSAPEKKMIGEILAIRQKTVNKIMIPKNEVIALAYKTDLRQASMTYKKYQYSRYPVYFDNLDHVVGILFIKDIFSFWNDYRDYPVVEYVRLPYFVYEDKKKVLGTWG